LPVNFQQTPIGGGLVQVGLQETSQTDDTVFVWTSLDHAGACGQPGCLSVASWYHNGVATYGSVYRFRIESWVGALNAPQWKICIRNMTTGEAYVCTYIQRTWGAENYAGMVWWLYETRNSADAIGHTNGGNVDMRWLQYRRESDNVWMVRTNMGEGAPPYDYNAQGGCRGAGSTPSWYHCLITNEVDQNGDGYLNDHDGLESWTSLH
jgi:hypothetical protein